MNVRRHIEVSGIVQGVGFRPHVYRLARERALAGEISNTPSGVTIEVQGPREKIDDFVVRLRQEAPPLAKITGLAMADLPLVVPYPTAQFFSRHPASSHS